nr:immunoglobulin light chain junction region [Macaca mulatta]MOW62841.1 immunoglobulin light chain junction region [Macaca mulatta]MOW63548.1 immunoglobulin light chain junction region [Macaca mulatta]MOW63722.1 immunoglobulin light chain junction region [Macaca mulatta]MOW64609.1 immunoglobulin light chain junction region [Macaca mulatta]
CQQYSNWPHLTF